MPVYDSNYSQFCRSEAQRSRVLAFMVNLVMNEVSIIYGRLPMNLNLLKVKGWSIKLGLPLLNPAAGDRETGPLSISNFMNRLRQRVGSYLTVTARSHLGHLRPSIINTIQNLIYVHMVRSKFISRCAMFHIIDWRLRRIIPYAELLSLRDQSRQPWRPFRQS